MATPRTGRPGGRTAAVRRAVLGAAADLLSETGLGGLEMTAVADRAGVGRSTVYRRWGTVAALVADLIHDMVETSVPRADTGSLRGDLLANADLVRRTLSETRSSSLFAAIVAAATFDANTAGALAAFYEARIAEWSTCVDDGVRRGEAPPDTDARAVIHAVSAPLYHKWLIVRTPLTGRDADLAADAALAGVAAGVFALRSAPHHGSPGALPGTAVP